MKRFDRWMFGYGSPVTLGLMRILMGLLVFGGLLLNLFDFEAWYTDRGFLPTSMVNRFLDYPSNVMMFGSHQVVLPFQIPRFMPLNWGVSEEVTLVVYLVVMVLSLLFALGWRTKVVGILLAAGLVAIHYRSVLMIHAGDTLLRLIVIYLACSACGTALSLDRLRRIQDGEKELPNVPLWPQRLIAIQVALVYLMTVLWKWQGETWRDGTATWYPSVMDEFYRFPVPGFLDQQPFVMITTYLTLAVELLLAFLPWFTKTRPWILWAGVLLHAGIEYRFNIPLFSWVIVASYLSFFAGEELSQWLPKLGLRLQRLRPWVVSLRPGVAPERLAALNSFGWPAFHAPEKLNS